MGTVELILALFMGGCAVALVCLLYLLARNEWVFHQRMRIIDAHWPDIDRYASYSEMMRRWWVWDIEKFKRPV